MVCKGIIYINSRGEKHICEPIGRTVWVTTKPAKIQDELVSVVAKVVNNNRLCVKHSKIFKVQDFKLEIYIVYLEESYYFVRRISEHNYAVILNNNSGFAKVDAELCAIQEGNITVFWFKDKTTKKRVSTYYCLQW